MFTSIVAALHVLATTLGLIATPDPAAIGVALAVVAIGLLVVAGTTVALPDGGGASAPHPRRAIDISTPLSQSDPDASGHPRPRAPQSAASAA